MTIHQTNTQPVRVGFALTGRHPERANEAAQFTSTDNLETIEDLVAASDTLFITTTDGEIANVWDRIRQMSIENKIICHFSGSLSSDQFQGIGDTKAHGVSIHPMLAFSDKYTSYQQLKNPLGGILHAAGITLKNAAGLPDQLAAADLAL